MSLDDQMADASGHEAWRVGGKVPWNVYGEPTEQWPNGRPVCQCHNAEDAALIRDAVNASRERSGHSSGE